MNIPAALIASIVALSATYVTGRIHGGNKVQAVFDRYKAQMVSDELRAVRQWEVKSQEVDTDAQAKIAAARADAVRVGRIAASLRDQLGAIKTPDTPAPSGCADVTRERDELADLLERSGELLARGKGLGDELAETARGLQRHAAEVR